MEKDNVNHPSHYNQHPAGIECIDVIRHYTCDVANALKYLWRAGLKPEMGKEDAEKEIEDLQKALWYIEDYQQNASGLHCAEAKSELMQVYVEKITGHSIIDITRGYTGNVALAIGQLLQTGLVINGVVHTQYRWPYLLGEATEAIQQRILAINKQLVDADIDDCQKMLRGEWVEGIDTVKPACKRETEPADYDPMNLIIIQGTAYGLTSEVRKKDNGGVYAPCDICAFHDLCASSDGTEPFGMLCVKFHQAADQEYYREVGDARYAPSFGTIQIVDAQKELEAELREINED